jgi:hypothetical protein
VPYAVVDEAVDEAIAALAHDAQTSGGLLAAVDAAAAPVDAGPVIGRLEEGEPGRVFLDP